MRLQICNPCESSALFKCEGTLPSPPLYSPCRLMYRWDFDYAECGALVVDGDCDSDSVSANNDTISHTQCNRDVEIGVDTDVNVDADKDPDADRVAIEANSNERDQNIESDEDVDDTTQYTTATDAESGDTAKGSTMTTNTESSEVSDNSDVRTHHVVSSSVSDETEAAWRGELAATEQLTPTIVDTIIKYHGDRGARAIDAVSEERVKRYRDFTVVVGHNDEYIVEAGGCTCKDSLYNLDATDPTQCCWHILATAIAERIGVVDHHDMWYADVHDFLS